MFPDSANDESIHSGDPVAVEKVKVKARIEALAPAIAFAALALSIDNAARVALDINAAE
ncbi:hypothetical protein ABID26_006574 [Mesorhizobium shonense]|uniref:Uncharacterized protein n=1 Tax=Mesorhizobium shonense TaxID=1209948 RepID=A0ABV2I2K1_9HYPH|nr:hypothetical protein [Mesorhizobium sp.]